MRQVLTTDTEFKNLAPIITEKAYEELEENPEIEEPGYEESSKSETDQMSFTNCFDNNPMDEG